MDKKRKIKDMMDEVEGVINEFDSLASGQKNATPRALSKTQQGVKRLRTNEGTPAPVQRNANSKVPNRSSSNKKREQQLKDLSEKKRKQLDISNHNLIEKQRYKVNRAAHKSFKPTKDSHGNNIKKHFGTWKYFVNR